VLGGLDREPPDSGAGNLADVPFVGSHDGVSSSTDGTFDDGHVDDVVVIGSSGELSDAATLFRGTTGRTSSAMKPMWRAHIRRSSRSAAMRAPVS
jgi:hypothetical protein